MALTADPTVRYSLYWQWRSKKWIIVATGHDDRGDWIRRVPVATTTTIDRATGYLIARRVADAIGEFLELG